jgi:hypothetical protein
MPRCQVVRAGGGLVLIAVPYSLARDKSLRRPAKRFMKSVRTVRSNPTNELLD